MQPIFNEYITFLKDNGIDIGLQEGYLWQNRLYIEGFNKRGNMQTFGRIHVDDNFNITYNKKRDINYNKLITWDELILHNEERLQQLENESTETTKFLLDKYNDYKKYICHGGGKDSTVLTNIVRAVDPTIQIMFNNTSNEAASTYKFVKSYDNMWIANPPEGFWQWVKNSNFIPSQSGRGCCTVFKHSLTYHSFDKHDKILLFMGIRNSESKQRSNYTTEYHYSYYPKGWLTGLPIRQWDEIDIWLYILSRQLPFNPIYKQGYKRCGCMICPFLTKFDDVLNKYWYPAMVNRWNTLLEKYFVSNSMWVGTHQTLQQFVNGGWKGGKPSAVPLPEVIEEMARYKDIDYDVAERFFNHQCIQCGRAIHRGEVIAMNMKFNGRDTDKFLCKRCFKKQYEMNEAQWQQYVQSFKDSGCHLF